MPRTGCLILTLSAALLLLRPAARAQDGKTLFTINCSACHLPDRQLVGPSLVEVSKLYGKAEKLPEFLAWCREPVQKREGVIQMPPMAHVGDDNLKLIRTHILEASKGLKEVKVKGTDPFYASPSMRKRPLVMRLFMPEAGPAAIAVAVNNELHYCWDAGECRLRYIWKGDFVDGWAVWKGNGNGLAKIQGEIILREEQSPLPLSSATPKFLGYRMADGLPSFRYRVGSTEITEEIVPTADGKALERSFTIEGASAPTRLSFTPSEHVAYSSKDGSWKGSVLSLNTNRAGRVAVTITPEVIMRTLATFLLTIGIAHADVWSDTFSFEKVTIPPGIDPQIGGIDTMPNGNLAMCFHRGEVLIYNPGAETWTKFAEGLHEPLGLLAESDTSLLVMQRPELTRIRDTTGDRRADSYETVFDSFGMTGNYHEFAFGPARDKEGNLYVSLNVASNGAGIRAEVRGEWSEIGVERSKMLNGGKEWGKSKGRAGRMYSRVPYRGWVMKVSPDGKKWKPFASGFRSPEGLGFDSEGRLYVTDNQGDWLGTSKVHHVRDGHFHGHPASLVWKKGWNREPLKVPVEELEMMRTPAMGLLPQGELANSPTQPLMIPKGTFGPLAGQMIIGEMNQNTLVRFLPDPVGEVSQGSAIPFLQSGALGHGNHRLTFTDDGSLWVAKTHLSWAGASGLVRVRLKENQQDFLAIDRVKLIDRGFDLRFTQPLERESLKQVNVRRHAYRYHAGYGSPKVDDKEVACEVTEISKNDQTCVVKVEDLKEGYLYTITLPGVKSARGGPLLGDKGGPYLAGKTVTV